MYQVLCRIWSSFHLSVLSGIELFVRLAQQARLPEQPSWNTIRFFVFILNGLGKKAFVSTVVS